MLFCFFFWGGGGSYPSSGGMYGMFASVLFGAVTGVNIYAIEEGPSSTSKVVKASLNSFHHFILCPFHPRLKCIHPDLVFDASLMAQALKKKTKNPSGNKACHFVFCFWQVYLGNFVDLCESSHL